MTFRRMRRQRRRPRATTDRRTPETRLEALLAERDDERRARIFDRIRDDLDANQEIVPWLAAVATLRDRLVTGEAETCYLALIFAEARLSAAAQTDPELVRVADAMLDIERSHGLREDESFALDDAPADWLELNDAWESRADEIIAALFRDGGLSDVAQLYVERRAQFEERELEGQRRIWGSTEEDELPSNE